MKKILFATILFLLTFGNSLSQTDLLRKGFLMPPDDCRPWVYWVWMDGNLSRPGITQDLEAMRQAGIGGVIIMEVNVGIPQGPVKFMSPEWRSLFKHVVTEAERLGIQITLMTGPGWTGSGGPWVKPEGSMQHIVGSSVEVEGPRRFEGPLPRPKRRPAFFGDGALPPDLEKAKNEFYRDVAVLAFPTPSIRDTIDRIDEKALYIRAPYSSQPGVMPFIPSRADYPPSPAGSGIQADRVTEISAFLKPDGRLAWDVPAGKWTIMRFGRTTNGANTRPAPLPGLGLECDKLDTAALNSHYGSFIGTLLRDIGSRNPQDPGGWKTIHMDSWEMGAQNWTPAFREEFRRRRGYELLRYLPAVTGAVVQNREITERFLWDLRQTANEMLLENHAAHLKELGRRDGLTLSIEPYDMTPCADMSLGGIADVPMCEFWLYGFNSSYSVIEATSIAHTNGRRIVAAEAFTSTDQEKWLAHPGSMKSLGDWAFCAGVNRIVFHRYQHQPWADLKPGMTMGPYGVHWERTQTWWEMVPTFHQYLSRCQYLLRQGLPVADVCFVVAEGAPHVFRPPSSAVRGIPPDRPGYNFDGCAPEVTRRMTVREGNLVLPDGMSYRVLVLPERETMTPGLLRRIGELVRAGATVIGPRPRKSPGLSGYPRCDDEVKILAEEIWGDCDGVNVTEHRLGKGRILWNRGDAQKGGQIGTDGTGKGEQAVELSPEIGGGALFKPPSNDPEQYGDYSVVTGYLKRTGLRPDFESDRQLRYTHRSDSGREIYFVANPQRTPVTARCTFRVSGMQPELWDPVTGEIRVLPESAEEAGGTSIELRFEPHQSFFVVFQKDRSRPIAKAINFPELKLAGEVSGPWEVRFDPKSGGEPKVKFQRLDDWSRRPEEKIRYYSGTATYRVSFDASPLIKAFLSDPAQRRAWLDLGEVRNLARVRLNGIDLGVVWCSPLRVEISKSIKTVGNSLEIDVANLWPNRLIGDARFPPNAEYGKNGNLIRWPEWLTTDNPVLPPGRSTFATWNHFSANDPLLPSGLLGPVRLFVSGQ